MKLSFNAINGLCDSAACRQDLLIDDQHRILAGFMPWLYLMIVFQQLISSAALLDANHSIWWISGFAIFTAYSIFRGLYWWLKRPAFKTYSVQRKKKDLIVIAFIAPSITLFFSSLSSYTIFSSGEINNAFVGMSIVALAIVGAFSIFVLPVAAMSALACGILPIASIFLLSSDEHLSSLGQMLFGIVFFGMFLLIQSFRNFADFVVTRKGLEEEKLASQRSALSVERLAYYDALTDLPNRRKFEQILGARQAQNGKGFAVGVIDIDNFKSIEDAYGRVGSDAALRQVAAQLMLMNEKKLNNEGVFARMAEHQFVFIVPDIENVTHAYDFGTLLCGSMNDKFIIGEADISLGFTCGLALYPYSDNDPSRLISRAELARKQTVSASKKIIGVFSLDMELAQLRKTKIERALYMAVENNLIEPWFQPIVRIGDGGIAGFEALARWKHETLGWVSPAEFIEIAEQSQIIEKLTMNMFERSLAVAKMWPKETKLFFNLSAKVLARQNSIDKMLVILRASGVSASQVDIELTETAVMEDIELAKQKIDKLKQAGFGIALDDFGSGYSSLAQIRELPLDKVKIDKSFTDRICNDGKIRNIVRAIIQLCNELDIACVVEGIEDLEQLGVLSDMKCELGQGYLFSQPIMAEKTARRVLLVNAA